MRNFILAAFVAAQSLIAMPALAQEKINVDGTGLALQGYDPVSYFSGSAPLRGTAAFTATYAGGRYRFATKANQEQFERDPAKYAPAFGGYCGYGVSEDHLVSIDPEAYTIIQGRLVLQHSKSVLAKWQQEPEARLAKANAKWPELSRR